MNFFKKIKDLLPALPLRKETPRWIDVGHETYDDQGPWWGSFIIEEDQSRYFKIGNIVLCVDRFNQEWHITTYREGEEPFRSFAAQAPNPIFLTPTLPDRALLVRLERPFYIPQGQQLQLYINSPLWIRLEAGDPAILLDEIPTETLNDTWFGKNTLEGDLCYAGNIPCSARLEDMPDDSTRITTSVTLINNSKETLLLHEFKIPLRSLSVYCDSDNKLWTEALSIDHREPGSMEFILAKGPGDTLNGIKLITPPRFGLKPGLKNIFSSFMWK